MEVRVNATRMQLLRVKKRLAMAVRGHKLLKDKRDELMKKFLALVKENKELREEVEEGLSRAYEKFLLARAVMPPWALEGAVGYPHHVPKLEASVVSMMNVRVPQFTWPGEIAGENTGSSQNAAGSPFRGRHPVQGVPAHPYGFANTSSELDEAFRQFSLLLPKMVRLAEIEKTVELLADEIEKTRRRVNALEYVLIPQLTETAKYITMKLDEMERGNLTRLMKVKDLVRAKEA